jgi:IS1 family transposase
MNRLNTAKRSQIVAALVEGNSIRATVRMTGAAKNTVTKLLVDLGAACAEFADNTLRGIPAGHIQCDEIWSFVGCKQRNVPADRKGEFGIGDVWTWTAIDSETKLVVSWLVGQRDLANAEAFMRDVAGRVVGRPQISTDSLAAYRWAVGSAFGGEVDYATLNKVYGSATGGAGRYSPPVCIGCTKKKVLGSPDMQEASTSYVERQNLTMRMSMRRFTRLTNGFSKKVENLAAAVALHFVNYNFCRPHGSLNGRTPAQAAGIMAERMTVADIVRLLDRMEAA